MLSASVFDGMDGELIVGSPTDDDVYRRTNSAVMSHDGESRFTFYVFDYHDMPYVFAMRLAALRAEIATFKHIDTDVRAHEHVLINNEAELLAYEAKCVEAGYEGLILRAGDGTYKHGRSTAREQGMLKVKRFEDSEAVELGRTKRSKAKAGLTGKGTMGALSVQDLETGVEFEVGTGFTAADRSAAWSAGQIIKYKFFPVGVKDKPRHPVYLGMRSEIDRG
jgi:DNA ligase-1